ncbi:MAG: YceI family protein [Vicinamibacterales bacterium]
MTYQTAHRKTARTLMLAATLLGATAAIGNAGDSGTPVVVRGGTAAFDAATNISAIRIHGKSASLTGRAHVKADSGTLTIEDLEASIPVNTLDTGMGLRDSHMRKHVFTAPDGNVPDLRFTADHSSCSGSGTQSTCQLEGQLSVRGTSRPFTIALKVSKEGEGFRAVGDSVVKLSTYGIPAPSQLGVHTEDDVKLHLDFVARPAATATTGGGQ